MSKNKTWSPPGWPFEMDLLSLAFVVIALMVPYTFFERAIGNDVANALHEQQHVLWAIGIVVLYVMQLVIGGATLELISTPFLHLIAPAVFAVIAYYRSAATIAQAKMDHFIDGSWWHYVVVVLVAIALSLLLARLRTMRTLRAYRDVKWDIVQKAPYDSTYWQMIPEFQPLVYPPRFYRASEEGILIEGFFYVMAIPFTLFQSLSPVMGLGAVSNGRYLASSSRNLIRIELLDNAEPLFISPANRREFLTYCAAHVARLRPHSSMTAKATHAGTGTAHETAKGTNAGTARGTAHGTKEGTNRSTRTGHGTSRGTFYGHLKKTSPGIGPASNQSSQTAHGVSDRPSPGSGA